MRDARFTIPTPQLLSRVVDLLDDIPMDDRDTNGDLYEYLLSKIASAGVNGQFRTPRHLIKAMVAMTAPRPGDEICDPACGTAGFLVAASEYVRDQHPGVLTNAEQRQHFHASMFHGYDFDATMLRIGSMNMLLHGVESPDIRYRDSLSEGASEDAEKYTLILANPSFAGSLDYESTSKDLQREVTANGMMEPARLYESPYTGHAPRGPEGVFGDADVGGIVDILRAVKSHAIPEPGIVSGFR